MIRYIKYLFLAVTAAILVTVALANRDPVVLRAMPEDLSAVLGLSWTTELPLFLVIFGGVAAGLLIGFVWEWLREMKHRAVASAKIRQVAVLERELAAMKDAKGAPADDVLAILDQRKAS